MNKHRVKAFTILELTITMLLTALIIGIAYGSYLVVVKSYRSFSNKNNDMAVLIGLDHLLTRDFERAEFISKCADGITLMTNDKSIKYEFKPDYIVRESVRIDTFKMQSQDVNTTFENKIINDVQATAEENRIDDLEFTLLFQNEKIPYQYHKQYSSANLMQRNTDAIN